MFRAEQAGFLRRISLKKNRMTKFIPVSRKIFSQFKHSRGSRSVIIRSIMNLTVLVRSARTPSSYAEMVIVRSDNKNLVFQ